MENNSIFTPAVAGMQASAIREIFKMLGVPGMISFAAGIPAPELFPAKEWAEINREILTKRASGALVMVQRKAMHRCARIPKSSARRKVSITRLWMS